MMCQPSMPGAKTRKVVPYMIDGAGRLGLIQRSCMARPSRTQPKWHSPSHFRIVPSSRWWTVSMSQLPISQAYRSMSFAQSAEGTSEVRAVRNGDIVVVITFSKASRELEYCRDNLRRCGSGSWEKLLCCRYRPP